MVWEEKSQISHKSFENAKFLGGERKRNATFLVGQEKFLGENAKALKYKF